MVNKNESIILKEKVASFKSLLMKKISIFQHLLPKTITPQRLIEIAMISIMDNPRLMSCSLESLYRAILKSAEVGLPIGSYHQWSCVVPYWNKNTNRYDARFQIMYQGIVKLVYDNDKIYLDSQVVYLNDDFDYGFNYGETNEPFIKHKPSLSNRGELIAVYAVAKKDNEVLKIEIMNKEQIYKIRERSKTYQDDVDKKTHESFWFTAEEEAWRKTCIHRIKKYLPLSQKTEETLEQDSKTDFEYDTNMLSDITDIPDAKEPQRLSQQKTVFIQEPAVFIQEPDDIPESIAVDIPKPVKEKVSSPQESDVGLPPRQETPTPQEVFPASATGGASPFQKLIEKLEITTTEKGLESNLKSFTWVIKEATTEEMARLDRIVSKKREEFKGK